LETARDTGKQHWDAELHRLTGTVLLAKTSWTRAKPASSKRSAPRETNTRNRWNCAPRASAIVGRTGRRAEASDVLAPVYGWFTQGFDAADLIEAKALLVELA
jgi:predicted ATPase